MLSLNVPSLNVPSLNVPSLKNVYQMMGIRFLGTHYISNDGYPKKKRIIHNTWPKKTGLPIYIINYLVYKLIVYKQKVYKLFGPREVLNK